MINLAAEGDVRGKTLVRPTSRLYRIPRPDRKAIGTALERGRPPVPEDGLTPRS
jgi:hypothetical protein